MQLEKLFSLCALLLSLETWTVNKKLMEYQHSIRLKNKSNIQGER